MTTPGYKLDRDESGLTHQEREVLARLSYGDTQSTIARSLGLSRERVRQIKNQLINKGHWKEKEKSDGTDG